MAFMSDPFYSGIHRNVKIYLKSNDTSFSQFSIKISLTKISESLDINKINTRQWKYG